MLNEKQVSEIREHLERAQNPVFYYDNDADGLCSFVLLRKFTGKGKGIAVKSYPELNAQYARKAQELKADYAFVLDKPVISQEFVDEIDKIQIPLVILDHHDLDYDISTEGKRVFVYNPAKNRSKEKSSEPVTYLSYSITGMRENLWLAVIGCIADHFMPSFVEEFKKEYPEFWTEADIREPFEAYYMTEIGRIAQALSFGLKNSITNVIEMQNLLVSCKNPNDIFIEMNGNSSFGKKYREIREKYDSLLEKAKESRSGNLIFFDYGGDLSISSDLANELSHIYPDKYIAVAYLKGQVSNISLRGEGVKKILERIIRHFENASGGGHENAVGARIKSSELAKFREILENEVN